MSHRGLGLECVQHRRLHLALMTLPRPCTIANWSHNTSSIYCFATEAANSSAEKSAGVLKIALPQPLMYNKCSRELKSCNIQGLMTSGKKPVRPDSINNMLLAVMLTRKP